MTATLELARQLLGFNTINPPGSEADCMRFFADWLDDSGFEVSLSSFGEGRCNLIASLPGAKSGKPLAFTGHLDTVPLGNARWQYDPFGSQMEDGRLYGRGSSDMKAAIAAFAVACVHQREAILAGRGAVLLITGGEETGCDGARALIASATLPEVGALIVGEPTANYPVIGHKGALWLRCETRGKTAHGAMPELGINAIYLAADALGKIQHFSPGAPHPLMKQPTLNVGRIEGGLNINSVPDRTRFDVDIRSAPNLQHATIRERLTTLLGESVTVSTLVDLPARSVVFPSVEEAMKNLDLFVPSVADAIDSLDPLPKIDSRPDNRTIINIDVDRIVNTQEKNTRVLNQILFGVNRDRANRRFYTLRANLRHTKTFN